MNFFHVPPFVRLPHPSVAAIGNFDGMHKGHQKILAQLKQFSKEKKLSTTVILFEPQAIEFFRPDEAPPRLQRLRDKLTFLRQQGIDQVVCLRFHHKLASCSAEDFVEKILFEQLNVQALIVGEDFRFGHERAGDIALLRTYHDKGLLTLRVLKDIEVQGTRISSTQVRQALKTGDFALAETLLGRPYGIVGKVLYGDQRGRLLGFPTANISLYRKNIPLHGVYAVTVTLPDQRCFLGVANLGFRPTISTVSKGMLEVFIFTDEALMLYGQHLCVVFLGKVRDEKRFESLDALKAQITADVDYVMRLSRKCERMSPCHPEA